MAKYAWENKWSTPTCSLDMYADSSTMSNTKPKPLRCLEQYILLLQAGVQRRFMHMKQTSWSWFLSVWRLETSISPPHKLIVCPELAVLNLLHCIWLFLCLVTTVCSCFKLNSEPFFLTFLSECPSRFWDHEKLAVLERFNQFHESLFNLIWYNNLNRLHLNW